jgi:hypothetical protein
MLQVERLLCDDTPAARNYQKALVALRQDADLPFQLWHPTQLPDDQLEASAQERQSLGEALTLLLATSDRNGVVSRVADTSGRGSAGNSGGDGSGITFAVVTSCARAAALLHDCCGLQQVGAFAVDVQPASISCIDAAHCIGFDSLAARATVHCVNSRAHLTAGAASAAHAADGAANASEV